MQSRAVETASQRLAQIAPQEPEERTHLPPFTGGIQGNKAPQEIGPDETPSVMNLIPIGDELVVDTGYAVFGGALPVGTVPQATFQVNDPAAPGSMGVARTILVTTRGVFFLQGGVWLPPWGGWVSSTNYGAGTTSFTLSYMGTGGQSSPFGVGGPVLLTLNDGSLFSTTIVSLDQLGGVLVTADPIPMGRTFPTGAKAYWSILLHGSVDLQVTGVSYPPNGWFVFTNQVDPPVFFTTSGQANFLGNDLLIEPGDVTTTVVCRALAVFHECMLFLGTVETIHTAVPTTTPYPRRVRMSDAGDPTAIKTIAEGAVTGIAAIYDLLDTEDDIHCAYILGPWLILYRERSIMRATYLGLLNETLFWEYMILGEGSQSTGAVAPIVVPRAPVQTHVFLGAGNVYSYTGDYKITPVGDNVFLSFLARDTGRGPPRVLLSDDGIPLTDDDGNFILIADTPGSSVNPQRLDPAKKNNTVLAWCAQTEEVWVIYTGQGEALPRNMLRLNLDGNKPGWFVRRFNDEVVSANTFLVGQEQDNIGVMLLCSPSTGAVFVYDYVTADDNGVPIQWSVQSKDVGDGDKLFRFDRVVAFGKGDANVGVSMNAGLTFQSIGALAMSGSNSRGQVTIDAPVQAVGPYCRLQFSGNDPGFSLRWSEVWHEFESEW